MNDNALLTDQTTAQRLVLCALAGCTLEETRAYVEEYHGRME